MPPAIMGIINVTPDSFYQKSRMIKQTEVLKTAETMLSSGASFLDIGGYSSRPGALDITKKEEILRIIPVIKAVCRAFPESIISVDTFRSEVAERAIEAGASMVNDISGGQLDKKMFETVGRLQVPYILMHMRGNPKTMKTMARYNNLFKEIVVYLNKRIIELLECNVSDIFLDVGFGFAKTVDHNYELLKNLSYFNMFGLPLLVGLSRKSMIYKTLNTDPEEALNGTTVLNTIAVLNKASILRVHDVKEAIEIVELLKKGEFDILN